MQAIEHTGASDALFERGQAVVLQTRRGLELGEVLGSTPQPASEPAARILRPATPADHAAASLHARLGEARFAACQHVFADGLWPIVPVDAEVLLDPSITVLYYLGPRDLQTGGLVEALHDRLGLTLRLESEAPGEPAAPCHPGGCGSCTATDAVAPTAGCGTCARQGACHPGA
jgi:cell fate regulator YaaT (PSP1 superfamily)